MLDIIETTGEPGDRKLFLVGDTNIQQFTDTQGNYEARRLVIVAAANYGKNGSLFDWAAYIGIPPKECNDFTGQAIVASYGDKLTEREVKFYLHGQPNLAALLKRYRE